VCFSLRENRGRFFWINLVKSGNRGRRGFSGSGGKSGESGDGKFWDGKKGDGKMYRRARNVSYPEYYNISCNILFLRY